MDTVVGPEPYASDQTPAPTPIGHKGHALGIGIFNYGKPEAFILPDHDA